MDCGVDTIETQDETGATRGIEIIPKGCEPVSEDICKSGFMAPTENVSFPEDALEQCCKCKEGETCSYCENPDACTEEEKEAFVTNEDCFVALIGPSPEEEEAETKEEDSSGDINILYVVGALVFMIIFIFMMISFSRRTKSV